MGPPCYTYGAMVDMLRLSFVSLCDGTSTVFYSSFVSDHGLESYSDICWLDD